METYWKLSDELIAQIAKLVQVAILTGTDVIDHMRMLEVCMTDERLFLTDSYKENFEQNVAQMLDKVRENEGFTLEE